MHRSSVRPVCVSLLSEHQARKQRQDSAWGLGKSQVSLEQQGDPHSERGTAVPELVPEPGVISLGSLPTHRPT